MRKCNSVIIHSMGTHICYDCYYTLITKANEIHYFSTLFDKELHMFRTDLLSIIRSLNTVFTATSICHTSYVDCLLARSAT